MKSTAQLDYLRVGDLYRDLDGSLVRLVRVVDEICCWIPVGKTQGDRQYTLVSHFLVRFRPFAEAKAA